MYASDATISSTIPADWLQEIDQLCAAQNRSRSDWLYLLIAQALDKPDPGSLLRLQRRIEQLEAQVAQAHQVNHLRQQVQDLARKVDQLQARSHSLPEEPPVESLESSIEPPAPSAPPAAWEDDLEDEPDEILYDFLEEAERPDKS
jgi:uncharacterized coiled-coil protein SlyX